MTAVALRSIFAQMPIILAVTAHAHRRGLRGARRLAMTGGALQIGVTAGQGKMRLLRVIEVPLRPAIGRMTGLALFAQTAFVHILVRVTVVAAGTRVFEAQSGMALRTAHDPMQPKQWKFAQVVIELEPAPPRLLSMAPIARFAELAAMRILGAMTIDAALA